jgi:hypothetical protein
MGWSFILYIPSHQIWENIFWWADTLYYLGENLGEKGIDSGYAYMPHHSI